MRELQKKEAVARMKMLGIFRETIKQFEKEDFINISEPPLGAFYWAEGEDLERIRQFEKQHEALVYLVIRSYSNIGVMDSYLFVSKHKDEWSYDRSILTGSEALAYVYNRDYPEYSEIGYIGFEKTVAAGLIRTH